MSGYPQDFSPTLRFEVLEERLVLSAHPLADFHIDYFADYQPSDHQIQTQLANAHELMGLDDAREAYGFTGSGQTVAVIDTGIAYDHYALGGGFGAGYRVVGGYDFTGENDANPYDDGFAGGHGTHVAGIIGSSHGTHSGVVPDVDLVGLRVFDDNGNGWFSWVEDALQWVHDNRNAFENPITAVNLSLGAEWNSDSIPSWANLEDEFAQLEQDGIFIAVAAGNSFSNYNETGLSYPAVSQYVIPVASVDDSGSLSSFSQRNDRVIAAPGSGIVSTVPDYVGNFNGQTDDFASYSGTSMASPYVAGSSVLVREAMEFAGYQNITQDMIYDHMRDTADMFWDSATSQSYHRLNLGAALDALIPNDDFGSTLGAAHDLGALADASPQEMAGIIGRLDDVDFFSFTAGATGNVSLDVSSSDGSVAWDTSALSTFVEQGNTLSFDVIAGQTYTVGVSASGELAHYDLALDLTATAINWGAVNFEQFADQTNAGDTWYTFQATRDGILSVEALFAQAGGDVDLEIYNANGDLLASSTTVTDNERVDVTAAAGESFLLKVSGSNNDIDFRLTNLVSQSGTSVSVAGTTGDDSFTFAAGTTHNLSINGVSYQFDASATNDFSFDGDAGDDSATVTGTAADDVVTFYPTSLTASGTNYELNTSSIETQHVESGGGNDQAYFYDSDGNDRFVATQDYAYLSGDGFLNHASGFDRAYAHATAGGDNDRAYFYDSDGNDRFVATQDYAYLSGDGFFNHASGFDRAYAYATAGGENDRAYFYDSDGNDRFVATQDYAYLSGEGFFNHATGFDRAYAHATAGGDNDRAYFYDSDGNDRFVAAQDYAYLSGDGFFNHASGFDRAYAYATAGGENDRAYFYDSDGSDRFVAAQDYAYLSGDGFLNHASGFDRAYAYATAGGENDRAYFYDSDGSDRFVAAQDYAYLSGDGFLNHASGFDRAYAYATAGGDNDRAYFYDSIGNDRFVAAQDYAYLSGEGFLNHASGFDRAYAYATAGGENDRAYFYDSIGNDRFVATQDYAYLSGEGFLNHASGFDRAYAYATAGGENDRAYFYDSDGSDRFVATQDYAYLSGDGFLNHASGFDRAYAYATAGGENDRAYFYDSLGDDVFTSTSTYTSLSGDGFLNYASGFNQIDVDSSGGNDVANLKDLDTDSTIYGSGNYARMSASHCEIDLWDFAWVTATAEDGETPSAEIGAVDYFFEQIGDFD